MGVGEAVGPGTRVSLTFSLELADGSIVDTTGEKAASFDVGDGSLLPGFEHALFGMAAGDARRIQIEPVQGFGLHNVDNVQLMPRSAFDAAIDLSEGLIVSFADQASAELPGVVVGFKGDLVEVDFNHPLAGKTLVFDVSIVAVERISNEIIRV